MNDPNTSQQTEFVLRRVEDGLRMGGQEYNGWLWLTILIPILLLGLVYVVWMYVRDARTVGWAWASFLGLLRGTVYAVLAAVFLLPALQSWDETRTQSKVVVLFDVSESTTNRDDVPIESVPPEKMPTRQDKVLDFLTSEKVNFIKRLEERNPITAYRFGGQLDEDFLFFQEGRVWSRAEWDARRRPEEGQPPPEGNVWTREDWTAWLKPAVQPMPEDLPDAEKSKYRKRMDLYQRLLHATNVGDSSLTAINREVNNMLQAVVIFSDGRSTEGSPQAFQDIADRAKKSKVPVFVVGIGQDRPPIRIDITDLQAPEQVRPDDEFPVRVEVNGEGLPNQDVDVFLDIYKPGDAKVKVLELKETVKFKPGEPPHAQAEFKITPAKIAEVVGAAPDEKDKNKKPELEQGEWKVVARVPKHRQEVFLKPEHATEPATINVVKRPLRVLLFAGAPMHEYQFVRTQFVREVEKGRMELSIYLQPAPGQAQVRTGRVQDVPPERLLTSFPTYLADEADVKAEEKNYNLAAYDLIIAFDADWTHLSDEQIRLVEQWVKGPYAGGLIVIGGPVNTVQLARPGAEREKLKPIRDLYPVILADNRLVDLERQANEPWRLNFPGANSEMEFLRLDEENPNAPILAAWEEFFTGQTAKDEGTANRPTVRGIYNYYPVKQAKDSAITVATFADPRARLVESGKEQPWLVYHRYGGGTVVWVSSGEIRRLRQYREIFFERFWTKLARFAGSGNLSSINKRITLVMGRHFSTNNFVTIEAKIVGRDGKPLTQNARPTVQLTLPPGVTKAQMPDKYEMKPKAATEEWEGWFSTRFLAKAPGEFGLELKIQETGDGHPGKFSVKESNPELDNTRPDFDQLYNLASEADDVMGRVRDETRRQLKVLLQRPKAGAAEKPKEGETESEAEKARLYFDLKNADIIPDCMVTDQKTHRNRGPVRDLWDEGFYLIREWAQAILGIVVAVLVVAACAFGFLTFRAWSQQQPIAVSMTLLLIVATLLAATVPLLVLAFQWENPPHIAVVLMALVTLLGLEWFTRKMLKLA